MNWSFNHLNWLRDTGETLVTVDGTAIKVLEFTHNHDDTIFSAWARHFRNHYCNDNEIDDLRECTGYSRADFLNAIKFPAQTSGTGPSVRAGDFGEILVADYLEYVLGYWVPRVRYDRKYNKNESTKGADVIAFKLLSERESSADTLAIFEVKAQFTRQNAKGGLQAAVNDSMKDDVKRAESLNAIKQRFKDKGAQEQANKIGRFQNPVDRPYQEIYGAAALFSNHVYDQDLITSTDTSKHPKKTQLSLVVIRGSHFMELVHNLYERAANEA